MPHQSFNINSYIIVYSPPQGSIFVNGHRMEDIKDWYIANTGYVLQLAMPYYEELTVRENLTLAAQMRLSLSMREKFERIEQIMNEVSTACVKIQIPVYC